MLELIKYYRGEEFDFERANGLMKSAGLYMKENTEGEYEVYDFDDNNHLMTTKDTVMEALDAVEDVIFRVCDSDEELGYIIYDDLENDLDDFLLQYSQTKIQEYDRYPVADMEYFDQPLEEKLVNFADWLKETNLKELIYSA